MRTPILLASILIAFLAMHAPTWGHAVVDETDVEVSLQVLIECTHGQCDREELAEIDGIGETGAREGGFVFYAALAALAAMALATARRVYQRSWPERIVLSLPMLVAAGASMVYADRLGGVVWLSVGWPPFAAVAACGAAALALLLPPLRAGSATA